MYNAEVLSKFPVVQHFRFGSLFSWEPQPNAAPPPTSIHTSSHPSSQPSSQPSKEDVNSSSTSMSSTHQVHSQDTSHASTPVDSNSGSKTSVPSHHSAAAHEGSSNSKIIIPGLPLEVSKTSTIPGYSQEVSKAPWATQLPAIPVPSLDTTAPWANQPVAEVETSTARVGEDTSGAGHQSPTAVNEHAAGAMGPPPPSSSSSRAP